MSTMNISLPDSLRAFVDSQVRDLIRRDRDRQRLRGRLLDGATSAPAGAAGTVYFDGLRERIRASGCR